MTDGKADVLIVAFLAMLAVATAPRGCGAYPPPALEDAPTPRVALSVTADDAGASTCAQMSTDDVMWQLLDAEFAGRAVRFVGCVEVVPW
jgi:hypothetical protein